MAHVAAVTHLVTVHSYTNMDMKHPPFIKKIVIDLMVSYYIHIYIYYHYNTQCVMVAKTAIHFVMGREIARMWQCQPGTGQLKSWMKMCFFSEKKCVDRTTFAVHMTG